jgi:hypothetical protein
MKTTEAFRTLTAHKCNLPVRALCMAGAVMIGVATALAGIAPSIVTPPLSQTGALGSTFNFTVTANGDAPLGYRWRFNSSVLPGSTNLPSATLFNAQTSGVVTVIVTNGFGSVTSAPALLVVTSTPAPPVFTLQPTNVFVALGATATFRVAATGSPAPMFQWFFEGAPLGSNSAVLSLPNASPAKVGAYWCVASNASGAVTSQLATLTLSTNPPVFYLQPSNQVVTPGGSALFRATASGSPTPVHRWYRDDVPVGAFPSTQLVISNAALADAGPYVCVASNASGMATSMVAALTVLTNGVMLTNVTIAIPAFDSGNYDGNGEHDSMDTDAVAGRHTYLDGRNPRRNWLAFHIPDFPGTLTGAVLRADFSVQGQSGTQDFELRSVETPVGTLRRGGFGLAGVFSDLADGALFGAATLPLGGSDFPLNSSFLAAAFAARGTDLAAGGSIPNLNPASPVDERVDVLPYYPAQLVLQLTAPAAPRIFTQPVRERSTGISNSCSITVGACGAAPLTYHWFVNGVPQWPTAHGSICLPAHMGPASVFVVVSNEFGTATSTVFPIGFGPENLLLNFTNRVVRVDDQPTFWAQNEIYPDTVQWYKDGAPIPQTSMYWSIPAAQTNDSGDYRVVMTGSFGAITSAVMRLDVVETPPLIWQHPVDATVETGTWFGEYANAVGGPRPDIRWYHNGVPLPGETNPWFFLNAATPADSGQYHFTASNHLGTATSRVAVLVVTSTPPVFFGQPANQTVYWGASASFSVWASSHSQLTFRWYHNGVPLPGTNSSAWLYLPNATTEDAGDYFCVASNAGGSVTSAVATLTVVESPPVVNGPDDMSIEAGRGFNWYHGLENPPALVQWHFENTALGEPHLENFTGGSRYFGAVQTNQSGNYFIVASNQFGLSTSRVARLTVTGAPPSVIVNGSAFSVLEGSPAEFYAYVSGSPPRQAWLHHGGTAVPLYYQYNSGIYHVWAWRIAAASMGDAGEYTVVASNAFGVVTSTFQFTVNRAGPLDKWTIRNPLPQGRDLHGVTWGDSTFVAVGDYGAVVTSPDGTNWLARNSHSETSLRAVAFGNGRFVATGHDGKALVSTNGTVWESFAIATNCVFLDVTFGNGSFLAVGYQWFGSILPVAYRSENGADWTAVNITAPVSSLVAAAFGGGRFVAMDYYGTVIASEDLLSWTPAGPVIPYGLTVTHVNGRFLALGYDGYMNHSADAVNWEVPYLNGAANKNFRGAAHGAGRHVLVGTKGRIITSTGDLNAWTSIVSGTGDRLDRVVFAQNTFVAVGENGSIVTSADGLAWTNRTRGVNHDLDGLAVANGRAVAVGKGGTILTSTDGAHWNFVAAPGVPEVLHGVAFGNGIWLAVGQSTNILASTNGLDWEARPTGLTNAYLKSIVHANDLWVGVGEGGLILTSPDAVNWTVRPPPAIRDLNEVTHGNGQFVAVGDGNFDAVFFTSPDGATWSDHTNYGPGKNARGIAFANGLFVAALNDGVILHATNATAGTNWPWVGSWQYGATSFGFQNGRNLRGATWSNGLWVAVGNQGTIITSTTAAVWRDRRAPTFENLHAVRHINNTFIAIGNQGIILQSAPLVPELSTERRAGVLHLTFSSPFEGVHCLQRSANFSWVDELWFTNSLGVKEFALPLSPEHPHQFYRVVAP